MKRCAAKMLLTPGRPEVKPGERGKAVIPESVHGMFRIGISGWTYKGWRGVFYPPGVTQKRELAHASRIFNSIEIKSAAIPIQNSIGGRRVYATGVAGNSPKTRGSLPRIRVCALRICSSILITTRR